MCNAHHIAGQRFIGEANTTPEYRMVLLDGYPGMFEVSESGRSICGEVWEVDEACKLALDKLEDIDMGLYTFEEVNLLPPFDLETVWTYLYARDVTGCADAGTKWTE